MQCVFYSTGGLDNIDNLPIELLRDCSVSPSIYELTRLAFSFLLKFITLLRRPLVGVCEGLAALP